MLKFKFIAVASLSVLTALVGGCGKSENSSVTPPANTLSSESDQPTPQAAPEVSAKLTEAAAPPPSEVTVTPESATVVPSVPQSTATQKTLAAAKEFMASDKFDAIIQQAKKLIAETKYADALNTLGQFSGQSLSTEQSSVVDKLKTQITTAIQEKASSSLLPKGSNPFSK